MRCDCGLRLRAAATHDAAGIGARGIQRAGRRLPGAVGSDAVEHRSRPCALVVGSVEPAFFVRRGFSIVPHTWVPEKIAHDCNTCPLFRNCGQYAIILDLDGSATVRTKVHAAVRTNGRTTV